MMKRVIYFYNAQTKVFDHSEILMDDKAPVPTTGTNKAGEALGVTTVKPADGLYTPRHFDLSKQEWLGVTREDWAAKLPEPEPVKPTETQLAIAQLTQMVTGLMAKEAANNA